MLRPHRFVFTILLLVSVFIASTLHCLADGGHGHGHAKPDKAGILLVAFGTSVPQPRAACANVERLTRKACPDIPLRWAYTSSMEELARRLHSTRFTMDMENGS